MYWTLNGQRQQHIWHIWINVVVRWVIERWETRQQRVTSKKSFLESWNFCVSYAQLSFAIDERMDKTTGRKYWFFSPFFINFLRYRLFVSTRIFLFFSQHHISSYTRASASPLERRARKTFSTKKIHTRKFETWTRWKWWVGGGKVNGNERICCSFR